MKNEDKGRVNKPQAASTDCCLQDHLHACTPARSQPPQTAESRNKQRRERNRRKRGDRDATTARRPPRKQQERTGQPRHAQAPGHTHARPDETPKEAAGNKQDEDNRSRQGPRPDEGREGNRPQQRGPRPPARPKQPARRQHPAPTAPHNREKTTDEKNAKRNRTDAGSEGMHTVAGLNRNTAKQVLQSSGCPALGASRDGSLKVSE